MPRGVYTRTEQNNKLMSIAVIKALAKPKIIEKRKITNAKQEVHERRSNANKVAWIDPEIRIHYAQANIMLETHEKRVKSAKRAMNVLDVMQKIKIAWTNPELLEKQRQRRIKYMQTHKGPFKDTSIEIQLHKILLMIFKEDEIIKQFYVKDVVRVDFYIPKVNLVLEADGFYWHNLLGRQERDRIRTEKMQALGYKVLRFWDYELKNEQECLDKIKMEINKCQ